MSFIIIYTNGGGFSSLFHRALAIAAHAYSGNYDSIRGFKIHMPENSPIQRNIFDALFDYTELEDTMNVIDCIPDAITDYKNYYIIKDIQRSPHFQDLRTILFKNKVQPMILTQVEIYKHKFQIDKNTLAVHIRLTDMNVIHADYYGIVSLNDYIIKINELLEANPTIDALYICSDNTESINKLKNHYSNKYKVNYIEDTIRLEKEDMNLTFKVCDHYTNDKTMELRVFTEILVASSCNYFIHRISDVSNLAILYSNTFQVIECIN